MRRHRHHPDDFLQAAIQIELGGVQDELAGFDFGEVQDVVDDGKQRFAGYAHGVEVIALFFVSSVSRASSVMPMMPFIGVRISWLMLASNSLLARLAACSLSRA